MIRLVHEDFLDEIRQTRIKVHLRQLSVDELSERLAAGAIALVLISQYRIYGDKEPHWIIVSGCDQRFIYAHDPYISSVHVTSMDRVSIPILRREFELMARYGRSKLRAAVILSRPRDRSLMQAVLSELPPSAFPEALGQLVWLPRIYITRPENFRARSVRVVNLSRDCVYLGTGYYASLLAEARGHKVIPSVQTVLDLQRKSLYRFALPELDAVLAKDLARLTEPLDEPVRLLIAFGTTLDARFRTLARAAFDRFRHPLLAVWIRPRGSAAFASARSSRSRRPISTPSRRIGSTARSRATSRCPGGRSAPSPLPRYSVAVLHNPQDKLSPSKPATIERLIADRRPDGARGRADPPPGLPPARRVRRAVHPRDHGAHQPHLSLRPQGRARGPAVIDDPASIARCTNKVYLAELLAAHGLPTPKTVVLDRRHLKAIGSQLGFPLVLKVPDGSFSLGVFKVQDEAELQARAGELLEDSDLILAQEYVPTSSTGGSACSTASRCSSASTSCPRTTGRSSATSADGRIEEGTFKT